MNSQHTPGPWQFNDLDASIWPGPMGSRRAPVATVFTAAQPESELSQESDHFTPEEAANARLIASAPEMLAALQAIHAALDQPVQYTGLRTPATTDVLRLDARLAREMALAAIAKATGGAQ